MVTTKSNCMMVATSVLLFASALLLSPPIVMAQASPWSLFQRAMFERRASYGSSVSGTFTGTATFFYDRY